MADKPTYYAIIPAEVRYSEITANAKLLYGEITALSDKKGYCFAKNIYFAKLYGKSKATISRWISELADNGFINVELIRDPETKEVKERHIRIRQLNCINDDTPHRKNVNTPHHKNVKDNITSSSTTSYDNIGGGERELTINTRLKHAFLSRLPDKTVYNDDKERMFIRKLIGYAGKHDEPERFLKELLNTYERLRGNGNTFWQGQPFLPSILASGGIYPRVVEQMNKQTEEEKADKQFDEIAREVLGDTQGDDGKGKKLLGSVQPPGGWAGDLRLYPQQG